jgi:hypothetical protein
MPDCSRRNGPRKPAAQAARAFGRFFGQKL